MKRWMTFIIAPGVLLCLGGGAVAWYFHNDSSQVMSLRTEQVKHGNVVVFVSGWTKP